MPPPAATAHDASRNSLRRADQVGRARADPLGVADHDVRAGGQLVQHEGEVVDQDRRERLHALDGLAAADRVEQLGELGVLGRAARAARCWTSAVSSSSRHGGAHSPCVGDLERALVDNLEVPDLLDLVAPELHPQRVLLGGREDVEDAAADGEVAALLDELGAGVAGVDEVASTMSVSSRPASPACSSTGTSSPSRGTCGCSTTRTGATTTRQRPGGGSSARRVGQPAQHGQPLADGVGPRGEPLVRQRLPARVERDLVGRQQAAQGGDQVVGLAAACW